MALADSPLVGMRVLEVGTMYAAPTAGRMLRDFGADVVKVEDPRGGDPARSWLPQVGDHGVGFARLNAGKRSVCIDLRRPEGQRLFRRLSSHVDVVIESFRPGTMERWGLSYAELSETHPGLVMVRVSGFGQSGPEALRPGFGTVAEAAIGCAAGTDARRPEPLPFGLTDSIAGLAAAFGSALALFRRASTGLGGQVDAALYEPLLFMMGDSVMAASAGVDGEEGAPNSTATSPRGIFRTGDGSWLSISASSQSVALRLFEAMQRRDLALDSRFATSGARAQHDEELASIIAEWIGRHSMLELTKVLAAHHVVASRLNDPQDVARHAHFLARSLFRSGDSCLPEMVVPGPVVHLDGVAAPDYPRASRLGEHTRSLLREWLELGDEEMSRLLEDGVVTDESRSGGRTPELEQ
jgi:crotonobetainyl-CoA:carnitine CoA-transferase CaiB-like acyl-CoA transferase